MKHGLVLRSAAALSASALAAASLVGCARRADPAAGSSPNASAATAPAAHLLDPGAIPEGPLGDAVRRGQRIAEHTFEELPDHVGNGLHCTSCHLDGGTRAGAGPWIGLVGLFPQYRARSGKVVTLEQRIDACFERSMNGKPLASGSDAMVALLAYMTWISRGSPVGTAPPGRGFVRSASPPTPDRAHGEKAYGEKCASCHGADGAGQWPDGKYLFPALWGARSFNIAAGMARLDTAAAFVRGNMPLGQGGTLSPQDAYDIADWFIHQDRPDFPGKDHDWPSGGKPRDARY